MSNKLRVLMGHLVPTDVDTVWPPQPACADLALAARAGICGLAARTGICALAGQHPSGRGSKPGMVGLPAPMAPAPWHTAPDTADPAIPGGA